MIDDIEPDNRTLELKRASQVRDECKELWKSAYLAALEARHSSDICKEHAEAAVRQYKKKFYPDLADEQ